MPNYVVERYRSRSDPDSLQSVTDRLAAGARSATTLGHVRYVHTIFVPEDETCLHLFEADSDADVRAVVRRAGLDVDRVLQTEQVEPSEVG